MSAGISYMYRISGGCKIGSYCIGCGYYAEGMSEDPSDFGISDTRCLRHPENYAHEWKGSYLACRYYSEGSAMSSKAKPRQSRVSESNGRLRRGEASNRRGRQRHGTDGSATESQGEDKREKESVTKRRNGKVGKGAEKRRISNEKLNKAVVTHGEGKHCNGMAKRSADRKWHSIDGLRKGKASKGKASSDRARAKEIIERPCMDFKMDELSGQYSFV